MGQRADAMRPDEYTDRTLSGEGSGDDPMEISQGIEQTRADMTATVDAIQQRLNPQQATDHAKESARELADQVLQEAKESASELAEKVLAEAKEHAQTLMQEAGEHAREAVRDATAHVQDAIHDATIGRVQTMVRTANNKANEASESLVDTIKANPIPAALVGIGLGWLWMNRRSDASQRTTDYRAYDARPDQRYASIDQTRGASGAYGRSGSYGAGYQQTGSSLVGRVGDSMGSAASQVGDTASNVADQVGGTASNIAGQVGDTASNLAGQVGDTASNLAQTVGDTAGNFAHTVGDTASNLTTQAQYGAQRLEDRFQTTLQSNSLAIGAVALALGTAVGLVLPQTQRENALMGDARDSLVEKAQGLAQETVGKVQNIAGEAQTAVQTEAQKQGLTSSGGSGGSSSGGKNS